MKKLSLLLPCMLACVVLVNAQSQQKDSLPPMKHPPMHFQQQNRHQPDFTRGMAAGHARDFAFANRHRFTNRPNFTKEQRAQLKIINGNYQKQLLQLQSNNAITLGEYKSQLAELKKDHKNKINGILTDQQKQKMADGKKRAEINRQVASTAHLERLKLTLGLNDEQVTKIKEQQKNLHSQMKSIRENSQLFPEQKRDEIKQLALQHKDDLKSVLTDEQKKMLDQKKADFNSRYEKGPASWGRK